jgi:secreted trypsin-like serine protease
MRSRALAIAISALAFGMSLQLWTSKADSNAMAITYGHEVRSPTRVAPWAVALFAQTRAGKKFFCSGSLIGPRIVLTAAHCVDAVKSLPIYVQVGGDTLNDGQLIPVVKRWRDHRYSDLGTAFDTGLVILRDGYQLQNYPALAGPSLRVQDSNLTIYGWGKDERGHIPGILKSLVVGQETSDAHAIFGRLFSPRSMLAVGSWLPSREVYAGACSGDSGGPLVQLGAHGPILIGVTSYGAEGCESRAPSIYTRVSTSRATIVKAIDRLLRLSRTTG